MPHHVDLRCRCSTFRGTLDVADGMHGVCYCDDCQAYAHALERPDVLDAHGGTDIWQTAPARVHITQGAEQIRCLRLSDKGMLRFHTACCRTPIGNTMASARVPFVGLVHAIIDADTMATFGPPTRAMAKFAKGTPPADAHPKMPASLLARAGVFLLRGLVRGRHKPTPFFRDDGAPVSPPRVLAKAERDALRAVA